MVLSIPFSREVFMVAPLNPLQVIICLVAAVIGIAWFEVAKLVHIYRERIVR